MTQEGPGDQAPSHQRHFRRSLSWLRNGRADLALPLLTQLENAHLGDPAIKPTLAAALLRTGDTEPALAAFESVLKAHPAHTAALHGRGLCLRAAGDVPGALDAFRRAVASDPNAWRAWRSIADITPHEDERVHAIEGAADALRVLCQAESAPAPLLAEFATAMIEARKPGRAVRLLRAISGSPEPAPRLVRARARALYHAGHHTAAFLEAARLLRLCKPSTASAHPATAFEPARAISALADIRALLSSAGVESFLIAGTLLGFHRNGGPLPHDRDIDLGVFRTGRSSRSGAGGERPQAGRVLRTASWL